VQHGNGRRHAAQGTGAGPRPAYVPR
jgi:hypothetical protein